MARRPTYTKPERPPHSAGEKKQDIIRIKRRIDELNAFDPSAVRDRFSDPDVTKLETAISSTLAAVFGEGTSEYRRYINASSLDNGPIVMESSWISARGGGFDSDQSQEASRYLTEGKAQALALLQQAVDALEEEIEFSQPENSAFETEAYTTERAKTRRVFIVHGHDEGSREGVARYLEKIGFEPIILHEQANKGRTVIEKVEANSDVGFAVVLLTPDDEGRKVGGAMESRARQNVLLELGYFIGRLGRENVCAIRKNDVAVPSDFAGVVWENMDEAGVWKQALARELQAAGHDIDWNRVMNK